MKRKIILISSLAICILGLYVYYAVASGDIYVRYYFYSDFIVADESDRLRMWLFQVSFCPVQFYLMIFGLMIIV